MQRCAAADLPPYGDKPQGSRCRQWDGREPGWAEQGPLCDTELLVAERDTRMLLYDYIDLEQALPRSMSQALDCQSQYGQRGERPALVRENVEALQRDIWWVTTVWAEVLGDRFRLADPARHVRDGYAVQRAVDVLAPRIPDLARLPATAVADYPICDEDEATRYQTVVLADVAGWEAVLHLSRLHQRARVMLGRTWRTEQLPGECSECDAADLRRDEPRFAEDPCPVYCGQCATKWSREEYDRYVMNCLMWPVSA